MALANFFGQFRFVSVLISNSVIQKMVGRLVGTGEFEHWRSERHSSLAKGPKLSVFLLWPIQIYVSLDFKQACVRQYAFSVQEWSVRENLSTGAVSNIALWQKGASRQKSARAEAAVRDVILTFGNGQRNV